MENTDRSYEKDLEKMSPFEIKNKLIELAKGDTKKSTATFLNAGRGNPNWISTYPREAFFLLGQFAMAECRKVSDNKVGIAGIPSSVGIAERFEEFLSKHKHDNGVELLRGTRDYIVGKYGVDPDKLVHEWAEGVIGDQYPTPDRILKSVELVVRDYLRQEMGGGDDMSTYDLFATEGGTAGMCYAFDSSGKQVA